MKERGRSRSRCDRGRALEHERCSGEARARRVLPDIEKSTDHKTQRDKSAAQAPEKDAKSLPERRKVGKHKNRRLLGNHR